VVTAAVPLWLSARMVMRFGTQRTLIAGLIVSAAGLGLLTQVHVSTPFVAGVLPGMFLMGLGAGLTCNPLTLSAMHGVTEGDYGAASGLLNSSTVMAGAMALALASALAALRTSHLVATGMDLTGALDAGYRLALLSALLCFVAAAVVSVWITDPCSPRSALIRQST
jgi:hypothetical protein